MDDRTKEILQKIEEAEYVLVGLGQEFDMENLLEANPEYGKVREQLQKNNALWLLPYVEEQLREQQLPKIEEEIRQGLNNLASVLEKRVILWYRLPPVRYRHRSPGKKCS